MLETLVSSRIRRTLFEYLLTHSTDRFYLRGLAKRLNLSISPLRRELARLEQSGMLQAADEGNMRFYTVNAASPAFLQLKQAGLAASVQSGLAAVPQRAELPPMAHAIPLGVLSAHATPSSGEAALTPQDVRSTATMAWRGPALVVTALVGMAVMLIMASLFYVTMTNGRLMAGMQRALATRSSMTSGVEPRAGGATSGLPAAPTAQAGVMRGARWRLVPGSFGGFSSGASNESY